MTKHGKLVDRLKACPHDFTFQELETLLAGFGYRVSNAGKTSGSAVRFVHLEHQVIRLHKPHPSPVLKRYAVAAVLEVLRSEGLI